MGEELWRRGAAELGGMVIAGEVSATEVVKAHLDRIAAVGDTLGAVVVVLADEALAAAGEADRRRATGEPLGPLHGVPVTIKENIDVAGTATTHGVPALAGAVAGTDAPLVQRLREAGAIVIGRTNLSDMGLRVSTDSSLHGLTRNPWHPDRTAGGSSGGEAAAIAAGLSPLGAGGDIGGSLRNPAHCCGITAIKPTAGRVPQATVVPPLDPPLSFQLMCVWGPMARQIEDLRLALDVMSGPDPRDPESLPVPPVPHAPGGPVRVALMAEPPGGSTDPGVAAVVRGAGVVLAAAGYEVEEVVPPGHEEAVELWHDLLLTDLHRMRPVLEQVMGPDALTFLHAVLDAHPPLGVEAYGELFVRRRRLAREWAAFLADRPVVVSPVWTQPAFEHGWDVAHALDTMELLRPVMPASLLGLPAVAVPGAVARGMPVGVQCVAAPFREDTALDAAAVIEAGAGLTEPVEPFVAGG